MRVLFLGSHCDDIELGCGGTIHKHKDQWEMTCATLCRKGYVGGRLETVESISRKAFAHLADVRLIYGDFVPDSFGDQRQKIWEFLKELGHELNPDIVITQISDEHQDHMSLFEESVRVFRERNLICYLSCHRSSRSFCPDTYEVISEADAQAKLAAIGEYRLIYPGKNYLEDRAIRASLDFHGVYIKEPMAEVFRTITRIGITPS